MVNLAVLQGIFLLIIGCFANNIFLELIIKIDPGCGPALTFCQFAFMVITLLPSNVNKSLKTPLWFYFILTAMFFTVSFLNNLAFDYQISQPVHMVSRSSSLAVSFFIGLACFGQKFDRLQLLSIVLVTVGILVTLSAEADSKSRRQQAIQQMDSGCTGVGCGGDVMTERQNLPNKEVVGADDFFYWTVGIAMLFFALVISALLGHLQGYGYKRWGKHAEEAKFYTHFLSLFGFAFVSQDILHHFELWSTSSEFILPFFDINTKIPELWVWVSLNTLTQWFCISGVYILMSNTNAVTVTLLLTLRKFLSLIFSVWYFNNTFMFEHWVGVACVFAGAALYGGS